MNPSVVGVGRGVLLLGGFLGRAVPAAAIITTGAYILYKALEIGESAFDTEKLKEASGQGSSSQTSGATA